MPSLSGIEFFGSHKLADTGWPAGEIGLTVLSGAAWFGIAWLIFHDAAEPGPSSSATDLRARSVMPWGT
jgi:hypothetical protein